MTACGSGWPGGRLIPNPEPVMTVARTVADVLTQHVTFEVECIDRMFLNVNQPKLQYAAGFVDYVHRRLGTRRVHGLPESNRQPRERNGTRRITAPTHPSRPRT
jgi:hypothetical protein